MNDFISKEDKHFSLLILWIVFFCYSVCLALIFQNVIVPNMGTLSDGGKLLSNDAVIFDSYARDLAESIKTYGWSKWEPFPPINMTINVAILGALYAIFGYDPSFIVPINAALHAFGGVLVFLLVKEFSVKKHIGNYAGILAAFLFIAFPSALNWYGQVHKDGYTILGLLLVLFSWVRVVGFSNLRLPDSFKIIAAYVVGLLLLGLS